jgi:hypothetical protein
MLAAIQFHPTERFQGQMSRHSDDHGEEESSLKGASLDFLQCFRTCLNRFAFWE